MGGDPADRTSGAGKRERPDSGASGDEVHATKKKSKKHGKLKSASTSPPQQQLPPHKYILAPMVGGSELAFRLLCRRYATPELLCYTPMMHSARFAADPLYRKEVFNTTPMDRPLVAHFSGNNPQEMLAAAKLIQDQVDAIDLNLGCPQRIAHSGHFGSFLLDDEDRPLVLSIIRTLASELHVPVFAKVRLLATTAKTIELVTQLRDAGAALVAIHARHRVSLVGRSGPVARDGPALLDEVAKVRAAVGGVELVANGNVCTWNDVCANLAHTGADGIMSAEGILDDPALYHPTLGSASHTEALGKRVVAGGDAGMADAPTAVEQAEKAVRRLTKKLREISRLEAKAGGDGDPASRAGLTAEECEKVGRRVEVEAELSKAEKAHRRALKREAKHGPEASTEPPAGAQLAAGSSTASVGASGNSSTSDGGNGPGAKPPPLQLAMEYLELAEKHAVPPKTVVFHVRRMAKEVSRAALPLTCAPAPGVRSVGPLGCSRPRQLRHASPASSPPLSPLTTMSASRHFALSRIPRHAEPRQLTALARRSPSFSSSRMCLEPRTRPLCAQSWRRRCTTSSMASPPTLTRRSESGRPLSSKSGAKPPESASSSAWCARLCVRAWLPITTSPRELSRRRHGYSPSCGQWMERRRGSNGKQSTGSTAGHCTWNLAASESARVRSSMSRWPRTPTTTPRGCRRLTASDDEEA